jgi:hypothetical protein
MQVNELRPYMLQTFAVTPESVPGLSRTVVDQRRVRMAVSRSHPLPGFLAVMNYRIIGNAMVDGWRGFGTGYAFSFQPGYNANLAFACHLESPHHAGGVSQAGRTRRRASVDLKHHGTLPSVHSREKIVNHGI